MLLMIIVKFIHNLFIALSYADNYFYEAAAQKLALQAIRSHQNAWYASRSIKDLDRLHKKEQKVVARLDAKEKKVGSLSDAEYDYRKNQEVLLLRISELRNSQQYLLQDYANLIKGDVEDVDLEGRRFYELENFDEDYSIELFQEAAVRNRKEFALIKEKIEEKLKLFESFAKVTTEGEAEGYEYVAECTGSPTGLQKTSG